MKSYQPNRALSILVILLMIINIGFLVIFWMKMFPTSLAPIAGGDSFLIQELNLRKDQKAAFLKIKKEFSDSIREAKNETRKAKDHYFDLLKQDHPDLRMVDKEAKLTADIEVNLDRITFREFQKIRSLLDPDQKLKFDKIVQLAIHSDGPPMGNPPGRPAGPRPGMPPNGPPPEGMPPPPPGMN